MAKIEEVFVIDSNTFMQAARTYYSFARALPFWNAMVEYAEQGRIISIDKVFQEIKEGNDELKEWARSEFSSYFDSTKSDDVLKYYVQLVNWAQSHTQYSQPAKDEFMELDNADAWIIAYALANKFIVVTSEKESPAAKSRIPIPNVCSEFGVDFCNIFDMLDTLRFSFIK